MKLCVLSAQAWLIVNAQEMLTAAHYVNSSMGDEWEGG